MLKLPVTSYVKRYLASEFGEGPYFLDNRSPSILRNQFLSVHLHAIYTSLLGQDLISVQVNRSPKLLMYYEQHKKFFDRAVFGADLFFSAFMMEIRQGRAIASKYGHSRNQVSTRMLIEDFMDRINLSEEEYSYDNLLRQYNRHNAKIKSYAFPEKFCVITTL